MTEQWAQYYTQAQLKLIQKIELENLRVFIDVCNKLNLEYFVYGGTLLGVEKYKGFIPWDDDVDVALPRDSYEKFIRHAPALLPKEYFLQSPYNCPPCPYPYAKLRRKGTQYVEYANRNVPIETGIYIDIYPVDRIPDDEKLRRKQFQQVRKWLWIYVCRQVPLYDRPIAGWTGPLKRVGKWLVCHLAKVFSQQYCLRKLTYYMTMYNSKETKRYSALNYPKYDNIYKNMYPLEKGQFEDISVMLPGGYKEHLRMRYGDYRELPPKEKRFGHVPYILDFGKWGENNEING